VNINTTNVLLESAYFNPERIQISSRYLGLSTEASQRFERGADPNGNIYALNRTAQLINELCGGEILAGVVDNYPRPIQPRQIPLQQDQINNLLGTDLTVTEMSEILESIDLSLENNRVTIPTFRPDLQGVADLAEEIARIYGLENIAPRQLITIDYQVGMNEFDVFVNQIKEMLAGHGLQEVITSSMVNSQLWEELTEQKIYPILNPISKDLDGMRNSLLPSLAQVIEYNRNRKYSNLKLFEINRIYLPPRDLHQQPQEELHLAIALTGKRDGNLWYSSGELVDFYDIKGLAQLISDKISLDNCQFISYSDSVIQEDGLALVQGNDQLGILGRLSAKISARFEFDSPVYIAEFQLQRMFEHRKIDKKYQPIPRFPAVERDVALIVDENLAATKLVEVIKREGGSWLTKVEIFDVYQGKQIPAAKKSLAFHLNFQSLERTLTEQDINELMKKIIEAVSHSFQAKLRE
jgi:phenylalanyl-tRNA synthetase beta chain